MANPEHLEIFKQGVEIWNLWRKENPEIQPDLSNAEINRVYLNEIDLSETNLSNTNLSETHLWKASLKEANLELTRLMQTDLAGADLRNADLQSAWLNEADLRSADLRGANLADAKLWQTQLYGANLSEANLSKAELPSANLWNANLSSANLTGADFWGANLWRANLMGANLNEASFWQANLSGTNLSQASLVKAVFSEANLSKSNLTEADMSEANLSKANLVEANLTRTTLTNCSIYGVSAWNVLLQETIQENLVISLSDESTITVDNLEVAQFIYLLLNNQKIREVIDTITSKVVLILGSFTPPRKAILDALREALRTHGYVPIVFDFDKPASRDLTGTISTLAHLARFIIVDLTDPSSAPHEVATVIPQTVVPVQPLLLREPLLVDGKVVERRAYSMFKDLQRRYHWVLPTYAYTDQAHLLDTLQEHVIAPAEQKAQELAKR